MRRQGIAVWIHTPVILVFLTLLVSAFSFGAELASELHATDEGFQKELLSGICDGGAFEYYTPPGGSRHLQCKSVSNYPGKRHIQHGLWLDSFIGGNFSQPNAEEVFVTYIGAEPLAYRQGGGILLRKDSGQWNRIFIEPGLRPDGCLRFRKSNGRDLLLCYEETGGPDSSGRQLYTINLEGRVQIKSIMSFSDDHLWACREWLRKCLVSELTQWAKIDVNNDGRPDLVLSVRYLVESVPKGLCIDEYGSPLEELEEWVEKRKKSGKLVFLFDGASLNIAPDSKSLLNFLENNTNLNRLLEQNKIGREKGVSP